METDNDDLQAALDKEYQNNKKLGEENDKLTEEMNELENSFKAEI